MNRTIVSNVVINSAEDNLKSLKEIDELDELNLKNYFLVLYFGAITIEQVRKELKNIYGDLESYKKTITNEKTKDKIDKYLLMKKLENKLIVKGTTIKKVNKI